MGLFGSSSPIEKLQKKYQKLMSEAHKLSTSNRAASDAKHSEAAEVLKEIEALRAK